MTTFADFLIPPPGPPCKCSFCLRAQFKKVEQEINEQVRRAMEDVPL